MKKITKVYRNKLIGTIVFVFVVTGVCSVTLSFANAKFISSKGALNIDGVVAGIGANSLTIQTSGAEPITVEMDNKSKFSFGLDLSDLSIGDQVNAQARVSGSQNPTARMIRKLDMGPGYGTQGDTVVVSHAIVDSKGYNTLTVDNGAALITFRVLTSTTFVGKNFGSLGPGNMVNIVGEDSGTEFVARTVFAKK